MLAMILATITNLTFCHPALAQSDAPPGEPVLSPYWNPAVTRWEPIILQEAQRRELDPNLIAAVIWKESRGRSTAQGPAGAVGLMMLMPFPWRPSPEELAAPRTNVFWGARALAHTIRDGDGDIYYSLAAYNGSWAQIHLRVTRRYATSILDEYTRAVAVQRGMSADGEWLALFAVEGMPGPHTVIALGPHHPLTRYTERPWGRADIPTVPNTPPDATALTFVNEQGTRCQVNVWLLTDGDPLPVPGRVRLPFLYPLVGPANEPHVAAALADVSAPTIAPTATITVGIPTPSPTATFALTPTPSPTVPVPTLTPTPSPTVPVPTLTPTPAPTVPVPTPTPTCTLPVTATLTPPPDCEGGQLGLQAWYLDRAYTSTGGWITTIYVSGYGGDCLYTYAWNGEIKGGPMTGSMTFQVSHTDSSAIIMGTATVTSAGETAEVGLFIRPPGSD